MLKKRQKKKNRALILQFVIWFKEHSKEKRSSKKKSDFMLHLEWVCIIYICNLL